MKAILALLVCLIFTVLNAADPCPVFKCSSKVADKSPQVGRKCATVNTTNSIEVEAPKFLKKSRMLADVNSQKVVSLQSCEKVDLTCPVDTVTPVDATCQQIDVTGTVVPGDICQKDIECFGDGKCNSGKCVGKAENEACEDNED